MYDEDEVHNGGVGLPYDEVVRACHERQVAHVAIYGYSRGGGATYDLTSGLHDNEAIDAEISGWIDAIESALIGHDSETRRPPFSGFHVNYYQRTGSPGIPITLMGNALGDPMPGDFQMNVTTAGWTDAASNPLNHFTIDDDVRVMDGVRNRIEATVPR